jgi:rSAM/selenodomain-associated transferase 1
MKNECIAVAVFAKAPIEGFVKTRLFPRLGPDGAARIQRHLIERTVRIALEAKTGPVSLWCTPDCGHAAFQALAEKYPITLYRQKGGDLGERMDNAFQFLTQTSPTLLMGTDCVSIGPRHLKDAARVLRSGRDALIVPVEDGGYMMIGLRHPVPELFSDMPWGTENVMAETCRRAQSLGLNATVVEPLWDIDRPEDYDRAIAEGLL